MEQRKAQRRRAGIGAVVTCPQFGLFRGEIGDLSERGLYLRTRLVQVCLDAPVTVTFQPDLENSLISCSIDAVVVRQDNRGIGIRFSELDDENRQPLLVLLEQLSDQGMASYSDERRLN